jgi:hypothetical protein
MRHDPPDPWTSTMQQLRKLGGRDDVMGSGRMPPGAQRHDGKGRRAQESGIPEAHLGGRLGALLD